MTRFVALVSGGLDSTVATALALTEGKVCAGLTVNYGQRAAEREIEASTRICRALGIPHEVLDASWLRASPGGGALIAGGGTLPEPEPDELSGAAAERSAAAVWVPNRNGLLINMAACRAEALDADAVVVGFNAEEAETFPDNSRQYLEAADRAFSMSTRNGVRLFAPLIAMTKREIVLAAREKEVSLAHVWPCYRGGETLCGACESCRRFERALEQAGMREEYERRVATSPAEEGGPGCK